MWHGQTDQLIPWRQSVHYYREAAQHFGGFDRLQPWFRFFLAPGVNHCGGGVGPQPQALFDTMVAWVETGVAPERILSTNTTGGVVTRTRPMCPYPKTAVYKGGDVNLEVELPLRRQHRDEGKPLHGPGGEVPARDRPQARHERHGRRVQGAPRPRARRRRAMTTAMGTTTTTSDDKHPIHRVNRGVKAMNRSLMLVIGAALAAQALVARAHDKADPEFTLASPGSVLAGYVTGTSVPIVVTSTERIARGSLKLTLNGVDVTAALHADGPGSMSGTVAGLEPGANVFELFSKENGKFGHETARARSRPRRASPS